MRTIIYRDFTIIVTVLSTSPATAIVKSEVFDGAYSRYTSNERLSCGLFEKELDPLQIIKAEATVLRKAENYIDLWHKEFGKDEEK